MGTLDSSPMGRFAWTNHIYFQITQPGSSTVSPAMYNELNSREDEELHFRKKKDREKVITKVIGFFRTKCELIMELKEIEDKIKRGEDQLASLALFS